MLRDRGARRHPRRHRQRPRYVDDTVLRHLRGCDGLLFESNHDLDMLRMGTYPWSLKRRIMSRVGHLSNDDSMLSCTSA